VTHVQQANSEYDRENYEENKVPGQTSSVEEGEY
jgi:hypothetical protein